MDLHLHFGAVELGESMWIDVFPTSPRRRRKAYTGNALHPSRFGGNNTYSKASMAFVVLDKPFLVCL